jgi:hypothetical protein
VAAQNARPIDEDNDTRIDEDPPCDLDGNGYLEHFYYWNDPVYYDIWYEGLDSDGDGKQDWVGGVDLNRNHGYAWNATCDSGSTDPTAEDYRGPSPFSEPETQAIRDLALTHSFKYAVSFHSGAEDIVYPWGYTNEPSPDDELFQEICSNMSALTGAIYEQSGAWYTTSGVWDDWMYANRSTNAFTCEIYGNDSAWQEEYLGNYTWREWGITQAFNPDPENIEPVLIRWMPVFTYLTERAITEAYDVAITDIAPQQTVVGQGQTTHVNVTIENQGMFNETFDITLKANGTIIQTQTSSLMNGESATLVFDWDTTGLPTGDYTISAYAVPLPSEADLPDNSYTDGVVEVIGPPIVAVLSPENRTYASHSVALNFTVDETPSWIGYSLDGAASVTVTGNTTFIGLADGAHCVVVYANNSAGLEGASSIVHFTVDTIAPDITDVVQTPAPDSVWPDDDVKVNATVTDNSGHLKRVTLSFMAANSSGAWFSEVNMMNISGDIWTALIPAFPYGFNVTYVITAEDLAGNTITTDELGYKCQYAVAPEFQPPLLLTLLMTASLLALAVRRKKNPQTSLAF